jgi:hypothetical protein
MGTDTPFTLRMARSAMAHSGEFRAKIPTMSPSWIPDSSKAYAAAWILSPSSA